jgi:DNA-directed RNA polymerase specialized sigma24 family protein
MLKQLDKALSTIRKADRELILSYYTGTGTTKIIQRKSLAEQLGIPLNALRLRVFRIRREIKNHMVK